MKRFGLLKYFVFLVVGFLAAVPATATAQVNSDAEPDEREGEATLYEIKFSRLKRLVASALASDPKLSVSQEILPLIADARDFAAQGEYGIAVEFLETALELLANNPQKEEKSSEQPSHTEWTFEGLLGSELWQQQFGVVQLDEDSLIYESQGNPFVGLRVMMDYQNGIKTQTQIEAEGKFSSNYNSFQLALDHNFQISKSIRSFANNLLDVSRYKQESELSYLDNKFNLGSFITFNPNLSLELADEVQLRRYEQQSDYFNSFLQNAVSARLAWYASSFGRTEIEILHRFRVHDASSYRDYSEYQAGVNYYSLGRGRLSLYARGFHRRRVYKYGFADSLIANDFVESYGDASLRYGVSRRFALRLDARLEIKKYVHFSHATPNYTEWELQPSTDLNLAIPWNIRVGYKFQQRNHFFGAGGRHESPKIEDFFSHGPVVTVDVFAMSGFIASLSHAFEFRRYPNAPAGDGSGLSLYSNRNINSLFFFMSWAMTPHWDLNVMAHLDYDQDQDIEGADSRTNLINFELSYKF